MAKDPLGEFLEVETIEAEPQADAGGAGDTGGTPPPVVEAKEPPPPPEADPPEEIPEDLRGTREALLAERARRKDWKGQAERAAGELTALRAELEAARKVAAAPPPPQPVVAAPPPPAPVAPNPIEDPVGYANFMQRQIQRELVNERFNSSEDRLRDKYGDEEVDAKIAVFKKAIAANPALDAELHRQRDPYRWMYNEAKKMQAMQEIGEDPVTFREKIEKEVEARVRAEYEAAQGAVGQRTTPTVVIPRSLGTAPSSAPRSLGAADTVPEFEDNFGPAARRKRG